MGLRVLVTGGRRYGWIHTLTGKIRNEAEISELMSVLDGTGATELCEGGASGADEWSRFWANLRGVPGPTFKADWKLHGPAAGGIRNRLMLKEFDPELGVAFPGGRGTADMVAVLEAAGVPVLRVPPL